MSLQWLDLTAAITSRRVPCDRLALVAPSQLLRDVEWRPKGFSKSRDVRRAYNQVVCNESKAEAKSRG